MRLSLRKVVKVLSRRPVLTCGPDSCLNPDSGDSLQPTRMFLRLRVWGSLRPRACAQPSSKEKGYHCRQRQSQKLALCPKPPWVEVKGHACSAGRVGTWAALPTELLQGAGLVRSGGGPCSRGGRGECAEDCVDGAGRGGGHSLLLWGLWVTRRALVPGPEGLARLGVQREKPGHQSPVCQREREPRRGSRRGAGGAAVL